MVNEDANPAQWALDLIDNPPQVKDNPMNKHILGLFMGISTGGLIGALHNHIQRRPFLSSIQVHLAYGTAGLITTYLLSYYADRPSERDARVRHYITLHPERFPEPPHIKFADILDEWKPIR